MDMPLLEWLNTTTFPQESKFKDPSYAEKIYSAAVQRHLKNGTTTCCYYASIHLQGSEILVKEVEKRGQRGFIGKVMDFINLYFEKTKSSNIFNHLKKMKGLHGSKFSRLLY